MIACRPRRHSRDLIGDKKIAWWSVSGFEKKIKERGYRISGECGFIERHITRLTRMLRWTAEAAAEESCESGVGGDSLSVAVSEAASKAAKSPKAGRKVVVKELEKQPNGSFMAQPEEDASPSPRTKRSNRKEVSEN